MKMLNFFLLIMVLGVTQSVAQDNAPLEENPYNQYRNEIGIDIQNIFGNGALGTGLIYKRRMKDKENSRPNFQRALVFQLSGSGSIALKKPADYDINAMSNDEIRNAFNRSHSISMLFGMEWQHQKRKIQTFYGLKTGYTRSVITNASSFFTNAGYNANYFLELSKEKFNTIPLIAYGGVKYFFAPRFSISVDSKFVINFRTRRLDKKSTGSDLIEDTEVKGQQNQSINYDFDILNTLNFSYYF